MNVKELILDDLTPIRKFAILLLSANSHTPIRGQVWYQKELFLLSKVFEDLADDALFEPYLLGPHSELADSELDELVKLHVVEKIGSKYQLTKQGKEVADAIKKLANEKEKALSEEIKLFLNDLTSEELLAFIYFTYEDMTEESIEVKQLIPKRKYIAIKLYRKKKVSIGKAAELAGVSFDTFIGILKQKGILTPIDI